MGLYSVDSEGELNFYYISTDSLNSIRDMPDFLYDLIGHKRFYGMPEDVVESILLEYTIPALEKYCYQHVIKKLLSLAIGYTQTESMIIMAKYCMAQNAKK